MYVGKQMQVSSQRTRIALATALSTVVLCGCTNIMPNADSWLPTRAPKESVPARMTAVWTDTIMQQPGLPGVRGVGGRLMFYADDEDNPVSVDGTLTVYAYDESVTGKDITVPARKFVFPSEQFAKHYSKSQLGHSYSVWLPWGETTGPPRQLTLITRFEPEDGGAVLSEPAHQFLPGVSATPMVAQPATPGGSTQQAAEVASGVQHANHAVPSAISDAKPGMETITIDVPPDFVRPDADLQGPKTVAATVAQPPTRSALQKSPAQTESPSRQAVDPHRTRRRLEAWLSDRRPKRTAIPVEQSEPSR